MSKKQINNETVNEQVHINPDEIIIEKAPASSVDGNVEQNIVEETANVEQGQPVVEENATVENVQTETTASVVVVGQTQISDVPAVLKLVAEDYQTISQNSESEVVENEQTSEDIGVISQSDLDSRPRAENQVDKGKLKLGDTAIKKLKLNTRKKIMVGAIVMIMLASTIGAIVDNNRLGKEIKSVVENRQEVGTEMAGLLNVDYTYQDGKFVKNNVQKLSSNIINYAAISSLDELKVAIKNAENDKDLTKKDLQDLKNSYIKLNSEFSGVKTNVNNLSAKVEELANKDFLPSSKLFKKFGDVKDDLKNSVGVEVEQEQKSYENLSSEQGNGNSDKSISEMSMREVESVMEKDLADANEAISALESALLPHVPSTETVQGWFNDKEIFLKEMLSASGARPTSIQNVAYDESSSLMQIVAFSRERGVGPNGTDKEGYIVLNVKVDSQELIGKTDSEVKALLNKKYNDVKSSNDISVQNSIQANYVERLSEVMKHDGQLKLGKGYDFNQVFVNFEKKNTENGVMVRPVIYCIQETATLSFDGESNAMLAELYKGDAVVVKGNMTAMDVLNSSMFRLLDMGDELPLA
jgi:hypothetical protein